jgi:hypothetical protein
MIRKKIFSPRLRWTGFAAVVLVWAVLLLAGVVVLGGIALPRPVRAQGISRWVLITPTFPLMSGNPVQMGCVNGDESQPLQMRFHLMNPATGTPRSNSSWQLVLPRRAGLYDPVCGCDGTTYAAVEIIGSRSAPVACSLLVSSPTGTPVVVIQNFTSTFPNIGPLDQ